jgi:hypothetical protein
VRCLLDLAARLLEAPLPVGLGLLARTLRAGLCSSSRLRASSRAWSASSIAWRMRSRRSSICFWIGPNANRFSAYSTMKKKIRVQIIRPGMIFVRGLDVPSTREACVIS